MFFCKERGTRALTTEADPGLGWQGLLGVGAAFSVSVLSRRSQGGAVVLTPVTGTAGFSRTIGWHLPAMQVQTHGPSVRGLVLLLTATACMSPALEQRQSPRVLQSPLSPQSLLCCCSFPDCRRVPD